MAARVATLTFDNGPTPGVTEAVLDVLARRGVRATFFVIGEKLADPATRRVAELAVAEGHWVGNHTMTHRVPLGDQPDDDRVAWEIDAAQHALGSLAHPDRLFRPYGAGGVLDDRLLGPRGLHHLMTGGYTCVLWNVVPRDWLDPDGWVERAVRQVVAHDWSVIALHDLPTGALPRLPELLDRLDDLGVELRHDLPDACVPLRRGTPTASFDVLGLGAAR